MSSSDMNLGMKCIKYMLFTMTLMFVLAAALLVSIGTTINYIYHDFQYFLEGRFYSPATLLVVIGMIMLFVSLFGCLGAIKESTCMINFFALLLGLVFIMEIGTAIAAYSLKSSTYKVLHGSISVGMLEYYEDAEVRASMDFLQSRLNCCGVDSYTDWESMIIGENNTVIPDRQIPMSCCAAFEMSQEQQVCQQYFTSGCHSRLTYLISQSAALLGTGAMTIVFIQLIGIIFSIMLAKAVRRAKTEREMKKMEIRAQMAQQNAMQNVTRSFEKTPVIYLPTEGQTHA